MTATAAALTLEPLPADATPAWITAGEVPAPRTVIEVDDQLNANQAWRLIQAGHSLLWRGDYHNARQMLQALQRRLTQPRRGKRPAAPATITEQFHRHRLLQGQRARHLGQLLVPLDADGRVALRRGPDVAAAGQAACGHAVGPGMVSLREVLGWIGAAEWLKRGVPVPLLGANATIHPHYGVFVPVRQEYLDLLKRVPMPANAQVFDIGTGTGVIAALLAKRGAAQVLATDTLPAAVACARDNLTRLGLAKQVTVTQTDLFPEGKADVVVCNPPWLPGKAHSALDHAIYDPDNRMLLGFLQGLPAHLTANGEGWLVISDLAEHLGLRTRAQLLDAIAAAGLEVVDRLDIRPRHPRALDAEDPLHEARKAEVTSLWRLRAA